jgi:hypothetical protein
MKKIIDIIFTFQGSIAGGFVRDQIINNEVPKDLDVILYQKNCITSNAVQILRILSIMNYDIRPVRNEDLSSNIQEFNNHYTYLHELTQNNLVDFSRYYVYYQITEEIKDKINLDILILNGSVGIDLLPVDFDCNLLYQNQNNLDLKHVNFPFFQEYVTMPKIIDRIKKKKFCLLPNQTFTNDKRTTKQNYQILVERAISLVQRGFKMDDVFFPLYDCVKSKNSRNLECRSFIVSYFKDLLFGRSFSTVIVDSNCPLCLEKYLDNDIVINVSCLHTFHWKCPESNSNFSSTTSTTSTSSSSSSTSSTLISIDLNHTLSNSNSNSKKKDSKGLVTWLQVHKNCPICRKTIIC